jgi:hypothetical protein
MPGRDIQRAIHRILVASFGPELVVSEWSVRKGADDTFGDTESYAPRLDIAVGPFNTTHRNRDMDAAAIHHFRHPLVDRIQREVWRQNRERVYENRNPRCLIAIEVEHETSSKHILGGITNASMLGLLGVVVGSETQIAKVRRIHSYARKLKDVGKAHDDMFGNVACFGDIEFLELLSARKRKRNI